MQNNPDEVKRFRKRLFSKKAKRIIIFFLVFIFTVFESVYVYSLYDDNFCKSCHAISLRVSAFREGPHAFTKCTSCHIDQGISGFFYTQVKAFGNLLSFITQQAKDPFYASVNNKRCLNCHQDALSQTLRGEKSTVRHKDFLTSDVLCSDCHGGIGHKLYNRIYPKPKMEDCFSCHDNSQASAECKICHPGRKRELLAKNLQVYGKVHPNNFLKTHGLEQMKNCNLCHSEQYCANCHEVPLPHPDSWIITHWQGLKGKEKACYQCHSKTNCDKCHGLEMPHPKNFLKIHSKVIKTYSESFCLRCHDVRSCDNCHIRHAHPNFGTFHTPESVLRKKQ